MRRSRVVVVEAGAGEQAVGRVFERERPTLAAHEQLLAVEAARLELEGQERVAIVREEFLQHAVGVVDEEAERAVEECAVFVGTEELEVVRVFVVADAHGEEGRAIAGEGLDGHPLVVRERSPVRTRERAGDLVEERERDVIGGLFDEGERAIGGHARGLAGEARMRNSVSRFRARSSAICAERAPRRRGPSGGALPWHSARKGVCMTFGPLSSALERALARARAFVVDAARALSDAVLGEERRPPPPPVDDVAPAASIDRGGPPVRVFVSGPGEGRTTAALACARAFGEASRVAVVDAEHGLTGRDLARHGLMRAGVVVVAPPTPREGWDMVRALVDAVDVLVIDGVDALFVDREASAPRVSVEERILDVVARARATAVVMTVWEDGVAERAVRGLGLTCEHVRALGRAA